MSDWVFDPDGHLLISGDVSVQLTPKAAAVLGCLAARPGEIVSRDDLIKQVWPGLHVTPDLVREYVHDLRAALGDDARHPSFIKTVRGRGYQLLGGIARATSLAPTHPPARERRATLAILRPAVSAAGPDCTLLAEDIATDLVNELARYRDISLVARVSSFSVDMQQDAAAIADALGADYLLECSLAAPGGSVRARFQLIDGRSGQAVWSDSFEHAMQDPGAARDKIVRSVVTRLVGWQGVMHLAQFKQVAARDPGDLNAFEHFIRGCDIGLVLDEPGLMRSIAHFRRSLELEPHFARCWAMKSVMLRWAHDVVASPSPAMLAEAGDAIERAYLFEPDDPTNLALVAIKWAGDGDLERAAEATRRAAQTVGLDADACIAVTSSLAFVTGDLRAAGAMLDRAQRLGPALPGYRRIIEARIAFFTDAFDRSVAASRRGFEHVSSIAFRALSQAMLDDADAALCTLAELAARFPRFNYEAFADLFPIAHPDARDKYDHALDRLRRLAAPEGDFAALAKRA